MPDMRSPDGGETLSVPDVGVTPLVVLGWSIVGTRHASTPAAPEPSEPAPKRGPGRPRKAQG